MSLRSIAWSMLVIPCLASFVFGFEDDAKQNQKAEQAKPPVSVRLIKVTAERNDHDIWFLCTVRLDNDTGRDLHVLSNFFSAFDGFEIVVTNGEGKEIARQSYIFHKSPHARDSEFVLKKGATTKELLFPISHIPADIKSVNVQVTGKLNGSAYERTLSTQTVTAEIKKPSEKGKK